jgi:hypothetical protein
MARNAAHTEVAPAVSMSATNAAPRCGSTSNLPGAKPLATSQSPCFDVVGQCAVDLADPACCTGDRTDEDETANQGWVFERDLLSDHSAERVADDDVGTGISPHDVVGDVGHRLSGFIQKLEDHVPGARPTADAMNEKDAHIDSSPAISTSSPCAKRASGETVS